MVKTLVARINSGVDELVLTNADAKVDCLVDTECSVKRNTRQTRVTSFTDNHDYLVAGILSKVPNQLCKQVNSSIGDPGFRGYPLANR